MFDIFKKKVKKEGLEKARELGLISEEEALKLEVQRAMEKLKKLKKKRSKKS